MPLLTLLCALFRMMVAQTAFQVAADVTFTLGEVIGRMLGFLVVACFALPMLLRTCAAAKASTAS